MTLSTPEPAPQPGKTRTWWHPLLVSLLRWQLGEHYRVEEEVNVGKKPLQIDVLLLRQQTGELPENTQRLLAGLVEYLNEFTLVEFKSPSDTLRAGDLQTFLAYALLYRAQNEPLLSPDRLNLVVIAPRLTTPYRNELRLCGLTAEREEAGIWRLAGSPLRQAMWLLETEELAGREHPLLTVFSPQLLRDAPRVSQQLLEEGHASLLVYVTQQIEQFRLLGERFAMQHLGADEELNKVLRGIVSRMSVEERLEGLSPEERLEGLSPEERLEGLSPEKRLEGLSPEKRLEGLTPEERERLFAVLLKEQEQKKRPRRGKKT